MTRKCLLIAGMALFLGASMAAPIALPAYADDLQGQTKQDFIDALAPKTRGLTLSNQGTEGTQGTQETSVAPLSCIFFNNCLPRSSMKLTLERSIKREDHLSGASCQHLSNSSTHAPASFPSSTSRVFAASL